MAMESWTMQQLLSKLQTRQRKPFPLALIFLFLPPIWFVVKSYRELWIIPYFDIFIQSSLREFWLFYNFSKFSIVIFQQSGTFFHLSKIWQDGCQLTSALGSTNGLLLSCLHTKVVKDYWFYCSCKYNYHSIIASTSPLFTLLFFLNLYFLDNAVSWRCNVIFHLHSH